MEKKLYWLVCLTLPLAVGGLAGWLTSDGFDCYTLLIKPPASPPGWVFPVVWSLLYLGMGLASGLVLASDAPPQQVLSGVRVYALQLGINFLWPLLFFGMNQYFMALICLLLLILLVSLLILWFYRILPLAGYLLIPYWFWLIYAGYLNFCVFLFN